MKFSCQSTQFMQKKCTCRSCCCCAPVVNNGSWCEPTPCKSKPPKPVCPAPDAPVYPADCEFPFLITSGKYPFYQCRIPPDGCVGVDTGKTDSFGNPIYRFKCVTCPSVPNCPNGSILVESGRDANNCITYACAEDACVTPTCDAGQYLSALGTTDANGCPEYSCATCPPATPCSAGEYSVVSGTDNSGCPIYSCSSCPEPTACPAGEYSVVSGTDNNGCPEYSCATCPTPTPCSAGEYPVANGTDNNGCPVYSCATCPPPSTCPAGSTSYQTGTDANGCPTYGCQGTGPITTSQNVCPSCNTTAVCVNCLDASQTSEPVVNPNLTVTSVVSYADGTDSADMCGNNFATYTGATPLVWSTMYNGGVCPAGYDTVTCSAPTTVSSTCTCCPEAASQVLDLVNSFRAAYGLNALTWDATLASYAQEKACDMSTNNANGYVYANGCLFIQECPGQYAALQHTDLNGETTWQWMETDGVANNYSNWGENIAVVSNGGQSPCFFMQQWASDCGHLGNLLGDFTVMGAAICNNGTFSFAAQEFGTLA